MALKVKTFGMEIKPLKTMQELGSLDTMVNRFVAENGIKRLISVSDTPTTFTTQCCRCCLCGAIGAELM